MAPVDVPIQPPDGPELPPTQSVSELLRQELAREIVSRYCDRLRSVIKDRFSGDGDVLLNALVNR